MDQQENSASERSVREAQENTHADSDGRAARDQLDKAIQTLQARAALRGFALHVIGTGAGQSALMVSRWNLSCTLPNIAAVEAFLQQAGVPNE